jgi:TPR repeat protein
MFAVLLASSACTRVCRRWLPIVPIMWHNPATNTTFMSNFFEFSHLNPDDHSTRVIRAQLSGIIANGTTAGCLEALEALGSGAAFYLLGTIHELGLFCEAQNDTAARRFYERGAALGSTECSANLAFFLRYGIGGERDPHRALVLTESSKQHSVWAVLHSSFAQHFGVAVPASCDAAFSELHALAQLVLAHSSLLRRLGNLGVSRLNPGRLPADDTFYEKSVKECRRVEAASRPDALPRLCAWYIEHGKLDKARQCAQKAVDANVSDGFWLLYAIDPSAISDPIHFLLNASALGSCDAMSEVASIYLKNNDQGHRGTGGRMLSLAIGLGCPHAKYLTGMELLAGEFPFQENREVAAILLRDAREQRHHPVLFQLATLGYNRVPPFELSCDAAIHELMLYAELSFLFDDARSAFRAVQKRDLEFALRVYGRLADMGSEAAAWNAEVLCKKLGLNGSDWFNLQLVMQFSKALHVDGTQKLRQGNFDEGIQSLRKGASSDISVHFALAWELRKTAWDESLKRFEEMTKIPDLKILAQGALALAIAEKIPKALADWWNGRESSERDAVAKALASISKLCCVIVFLLTLYVLVGVRVRSCMRHPI